MTLKQLSRWISTGLLALVLAACETASLDAPGIDRGQGIVADFSIEPNTNIALYDPPTTSIAPELTYGSMDAHFITLDDVTYMVDWNHVSSFKGLKKGDKISFRSTGKLARKQSNGQNYKVIMLNGM